MKEIEYMTYAEVWQVILRTRFRQVRGTYIGSLWWRREPTLKEQLTRWIRLRDFWEAPLRRIYAKMPTHKSFEEWVKGRGYHRDALGRIITEWSEYKYEIARKLFNVRECNENYDAFTFGVGPKNGCEHVNATCSFNIGSDCSCPDCKAEW